MIGKSTSSDPNAFQVLPWDDERLPRLWQPRRGEWKVPLLGCGTLFSLITFCGFGCVAIIWNPDRGVMLVPFGIIMAAATASGLIIGGIIGARDAFAEKKQQAMLEAELSEDEVQDLLRLVKRVFKEEQWLLVEPVKIAGDSDKWIVSTNPEGIGCNGFLVVDKRTKEIVRKGFLPR